MNLKFMRRVPLMTLDPRNLHAKSRFLLILSPLRMQNNWPVKSDQISTSVTCVYVEASERCGSGFNMFLINLFELFQDFISKSNFLP